MFDALKKSMIDAIEEGQLKLGYRDETIRLYYPLESLCALTGKKLDAAQMMRELEAFFTEDEAELGKIEISRRGDRFCLAVGPKGAAWVHAHTNPNGFLAAFIAAIGRHGCTMDELLAQSDFISLHTPAIDGKPLINRENIAKMKDGVIFVNTSRGNNVDEEALLEGLNSGKIRGAGLDVYAEEPAKNEALLNHPNVSCTPHIGAATKEAQKRIGMEIVSIIDNL